MADLSSVDLVALIERETGGAIRFAGAVGRDDTRKGGPCPFCTTGEDRFAVFTADIPQHYYCGVHGHGCGAWGDAITFVRSYLGINDYFDACDYLDVDPDSKYDDMLQWRKKPVEEEDKPPSDAWQVMGMEFCRNSKATLQGNDKAMDWLVSVRGLSDITIDRYGLGFNAETRWVEPTEWGLPSDEKKVWLPRGWVFPYQIDGHLWKVSIRRLDHDIVADRERYAKEGRKGDPPKYVDIRGGSQGLYGTSEIRPGEPLLLVEGPIDKLVFTQQVGYRVPCVATGSTGQSRAKRWVDELRQASFVLVAYDFDETNKAGDEAAKHWRKQLQQARRLTPWAHDVNDMYLAGIDLDAWVNVGLEGTTVAVSVPPPVIQQVEEAKVSREQLGWETEEAFLGGVHEIAQHLEDMTGMSWNVRLLPKGFTLADRVKELQTQQAAQERAAEQRRVEQEGAIREARAHVGIPSWLKPGTDDWRKQVVRNGTKEMLQRRQAWFEQQRAEAHV